jgi:predicted dehydrogenase
LTTPATIGVGVVGLGQGQSHLRAFQLLDGTRVVAVCDLDAALAERVARERGVARHYRHVEQLLADREVDLVVIATPDHLHGQQAIAALEAGKHVLSEIPMALTIDECARIVALTDRHGLKYHLGNQVRYAFCLRDVQRLIAAGEFGDIFYGEGEYLHDMPDIVAGRPADHWRIAGEPQQTTLLGGGPHALDTLRWLMGVRFVETQAYHVAARNRWGALHTTCALFKAANGAVAKITVSYGMQRPYCLYYSVYGTAGSFERTRDQGRPLDETTNYLYHSRLSGSRRLIPVTVPNWANPRLLRELGQGLGHGTMEIEQAQDLLRAIREDAEPALGPREAAASIVPLICALQSAHQGGGPIAIPEVG